MNNASVPFFFHLRQLGRADYEPTWRAMQDFTAARDADTADEIWLLEHPPVFTLGLNSKPEHLLNPDNIPVIKIDRGGQVTYHGPGQLVVYVLLDIARRSLGVQQLVQWMEQAVIDLLAEQQVEAVGRRDAPGVYVAGRKIAALGLRVKRGRTYHGLALNVDMDLEPFNRINPCGYPGMQVTQLRDLGISLDMDAVSDRLLSHLTRLLGYTAQQSGDRHF
ncbi:MAG: lipoyl(octanoyl) transferase LipB [Gammaproteobacteria bacterium]|nr:lipoyl(octanoyl) transferase LipB [Gammaproteobacteria bacterium]